MRRCSQPYAQSTLTSAVPCRSEQCPADVTAGDPYSFCVNMCLTPSVSVARQHMWGVSPEGPYHQAKNGSPQDRVDHVRTRVLAIPTDVRRCALLSPLPSCWLTRTGVACNPADCRAWQQAD